MLDPRIYRTGLVAVVVAVIVVAFSLTGQQGPLQGALTPDAFGGSTAYNTMLTVAGQYPDRRPGSPGDEHVADAVAQALGGDGFLVQRSVFDAQTVDGRRTLETVTATLAGSTSGAILVVAHRDSVHSPGVSDLSGTAVLLELAQVLSAQTQQRTIVLASTSGSVGAAGAAELAGSLPGPVDAVIVLGDMAGTNVTRPVVVPWSDSTLVAPSALRNTLATAVEQQAGLPAGQQSLGGQILHLAFPLALSEQRPFARAGLPAVLVSTSGARIPAADERPSEPQMDGFGRAVLQAITALNNGPEVAGPSSYLRLSRELIPEWAVRLLVLALIAPVLAATVDGLARARRRGYAVGRWVLWVLSAGAPFVLAVLVIEFLRLVGLIDIAPPGPVGGDALTLHTRATAILIGLGCLVALSAAAVWQLWRRAAPPAAATATTTSNGRGGRRRRRGPDDAASPGAAAALLLVLCVISLVIWVSNPYAAGLIVPALHLWMWIVAPERSPRPPVAVVMFAAGLAPGVVALLYYANTMGLRPAAAVWNAVLMLAGGDVRAVTALEWSIVLGCTVSLALMIVRIVRQPRPADLPVSVGGPVTVAGVGGAESLGGIGSALRQ
jgi:Peptidase family M28